MAMFLLVPCILSGFCIGKMFFTPKNLGLLPEPMHFDKDYRSHSMPTTTPYGGGHPGHGSVEDPRARHHSAMSHSRFEREYETAEASQVEGSSYRALTE